FSFGTGLGLVGFSILGESALEGLADLADRRVRRGVGERIRRGMEEAVQLAELARLQRAVIGRRVIARCRGRVIIIGARIIGFAGLGTLARVVALARIVMAAG